MFIRSSQIVPVLIKLHVITAYGLKKKVKCTLVQALKLFTGRTAHREVEV
jgi:hypothetical protein